MARSAKERAEYFKGFSVIKDTTEIDELIHGDDSITIEDCKGSVLIELPRATFGGLTTTQIFQRASELADEHIPYGIKFIVWSHTYKGNDSFIRFTVESWEAIPQEERDQDAYEAAQDDKFEARREARLG